MKKRYSDTYPPRHNCTCTLVPLLSRDLDPLLQVLGQLLHLRQAETHHIAPEPERSVLGVQEAIEIRLSLVSLLKLRLAVKSWNDCLNAAPCDPSGVVCRSPKLRLFEKLANLLFRLLFPSLFSCVPTARRGA